MERHDLQQETSSARDARSAMAMQDWVRACELWAVERIERPGNLQAYISGIESLVRAYHFEEAFALVEKMSTRFAGSNEAELVLAELKTRRGQRFSATELYDSIAVRSEALADRVASLPYYR